MTSDSRFMAAHRLKVWITHVSLLWWTSCWAAQTTPATEAPQDLLPVIRLPVDSALLLPGFLSQAGVCAAGVPCGLKNIASTLMAKALQEAPNSGEHPPQAVGRCQIQAQKFFHYAWSFR